MNAAITFLSGVFTGVIGESFLVDAGPMIEAIEEILSETAPVIAVHDDGPLAEDTKESVVIMPANASRYGDAGRLARRVDQLDDYQKGVIQRYMREIGDIGLSVSLDETTLRATLSGCLADIDYEKFLGVRFLSDATGISVAVPIVIEIDLWKTLQWHHIGAENRKHWFREAAYLLGIRTDRPHGDWKLARDVFSDMSEARQEEMIAIMGAPIPYVADLDQMMMIGRNYMIHVV